MDKYVTTTPFGRRPMTLAHVAAQAAASAKAPNAAVHKWAVFRDICAAKGRVGVSDRSLAVLNGLLSFHQETVLTGEGGIIVYPSNHQLSLRANGMAPSTLRRHLAALVDAGLVVRRDSPNGKRFARKGRGGDVEVAFGFDLSLLFARAAELACWAEEARAAQRELSLARERITLCRRDISKMVAAGMEDGVPVRAGPAGPADWADVHALLRGIVTRIPRNGGLAELEPLADELTALAEEVHNILSSYVESNNKSANESQNERHKQNSKTENLIEFEPVLEKGQGGRPEPIRTKAGPPQGAYPLGMVMSACPDVADYSRQPIASWRDLLAIAEVVRPMLGISPSAWTEAREAMGERQASIVMACILQRSEAISSAGGYMRELTRKAAAGAFSPGPMLMALIARRTKGRGGARA